MFFVLNLFLFFLETHDAKSILNFFEQKSILDDSIFYRGITFTFIYIFVTGIARNENICTQCK